MITLSRNKNEHAVTWPLCVQDSLTDFLTICLLTIWKCIRHKGPHSISIGFVEECDWRFWCEILIVNSLNKNKTGKKNLKSFVSISKFLFLNHYWQKKIYTVNEWSKINPTITTTPQNKINVKIQQLFLYIYAPYLLKNCLCVIRAEEIICGGVTNEEYRWWVDLLAAQTRDSTAGRGPKRRTWFSPNTFKFMAMVDGKSSPKKRVNLRESLTLIC